MRCLAAVLTVVVVSLYTKSALAAPPPKQLPCQKISILGRTHRLCWTFDDHPSKFTPGVLKVLRKHKIRATFFVVGWPLFYYARYPKDKNTQLYHKWFKDILRDKHVIGNHTLTHANLCRSSRKKIRRELKSTQRYILRFGKVKATMWRAPFIALCGKALREARKLKLTHVGCHVQDWRRTAKQMWRSLRWRVLHGKKYSIILLHMNLYRLRQFLQLIKKHP